MVSTHRVAKAAGVVRQEKEGGRRTELKWWCPVCDDRSPLFPTAVCNTKHVNCSFHQKVIQKEDTSKVIAPSLIYRYGSKISASHVEIPTSTNEAYWKVERERGNELLKISNGDPPPPPAKPEEMGYEVVLSPPPRSRPLPTIPFPLSGGTEEEDCTTAVYEVIPGDHWLIIDY